MARRSTEVTAITTEQKMSLVQIVDNIEQLSELVEAAGNDDEREAAESELARCITEELVSKVDGFGWYKKRKEQQVKALKESKQEVIDDINRAIDRLEKRWDRIRRLAQTVLVKRPEIKLKGEVYSITLCPGRQSLEIFDPKAIPDKYRTVTVCMSAEVWEQVRMLPVTRPLADPFAGKEETTPLDDNVREFYYSVDEPAVRSALKADEEVPGARMKTGDDYVQVA